MEEKPTSDANSITAQSNANIICILNSKLFTTKIILPAIYNRFAGGIFIVIYIDILFVINFFITFFLLQATAKFAKKKVVVWRFIFASTVGGLYSFIILADISKPLAVFSKLFAAGIIILVAFHFEKLANFAAVYALFFVMNYMFLGVIYGITIMFDAEYITLSNSTVYVSIGARGLLVSAFFAYIVSCVVVRLYNRRLSANQVYSLTVENCGKTAKLLAFADKGNNLREPFSNSPVIVADKQKMEPLMERDNTRIIPTTTVGGKSFLLSFKPDKVTVKTNRGKEEIENVYIALSDDIKDGSFSAVINPEILTV